MCGIVAIYNYKKTASEFDCRELDNIRNKMINRGPDGEGTWLSQGGNVGLGHRRLTIIDLSGKGAQPMKNSAGDLIISFNGEIYNYQELRRKLLQENYTFNSNSDTEVILNLYAQKGEAMFGDLRGMFAFALWDAKKQTLILARDPYGIKPLYYSDNGKTLRAASQVKALIAGGNISKQYDPAGIVSFFLMGSIQEPYTLYRDIKSVPAGSYIKIDASGVSVPTRYFSLPSIYEKANCTKENLSRADCAEITKDVLTETVRYHFVADVPVGIFLSSGIDSGTLLSLATELGIDHIRTVTLAFDEFAGQHEDEAPLAEIVARHYRSQHTTYRLSKKEFSDDLPKIFKAMDQPSIDGINTYFVSKAVASIGLKVALSGLGGDELFGGYPSFKDIPRMVRFLSIPSRIPLLGDSFRALYSALSSQPSALSPKIAGLLKYGGTYAGAYYLKRGLFMPWELETVLDRDLVHEGLRKLDIVSQIDSELCSDLKNTFAKIASLESSLYMRNQLLRDTDWAGMAHSIELRTPFVDAFLLKELAPVLLSYCGKNRKKDLMTQSLKNPLPTNVLNRFKTGFTVPVYHWLETDKRLNAWKRIPSLANPRCHWSRRWAYIVHDLFQMNT